MKNKNFIILAALLIISILLITLGIAPTAKKILADNRAITEEKEKMNNLLLRGQNIVKNKNNLAVVEEQLALIENAYLQTGQELAFITDLEKTAAKNNIEQSIIFNNTEITEVNGLKAIPLSLQLTGGVEEIMNYINDLERFDYYIDIERISLSSQGVATSSRRAGEQSYQEQENDQKTNGQSTATLSVSLQGLTYWK
ncbi:MAG TPA: hypothetical protein P5267_03595 [Patescibacteria group bacterium]|nr:hypothetical protein [Patescibacteria group bacterium]